MISKDDIIKIIEYGTYAPSGDNSQPWRFEVESGSDSPHEARSVIKVFNILGKDNPILNIRNRGSYVAHGAVVENMVIAASKMGFEAEVKVFPEDSSPHMTASVILTSGVPANEPLFDSIKERVTNRKPYKKEPLSDREKRDLADAGRIAGVGELKILESRDDLQNVAHALSVTERVALETPALHALFFGGMLWNEEENKRGESGLYIKTIEVPLTVQFLFRLIKKWPAMKCFNAIGFPLLAARSNAALYASSGAFGAIVVPDTDEDFFRAGRILERVWLTATKLGLSFQPVTGILFLNQRIQSPEGHPFSRENAERIKEAYAKIEASFGARGKIIAMLFRVGKDGEPSARSYRKKPEITFQ
ncbi:MAG: hypothetical protein HYW09_01230 [Candidatus Niyogibacteria bacterium]|nr:hypothetical protein [Candidatus Niyogibacteria bacterium]